MRGTLRDLTGTLSILESAEVIRRSSLFIGLDSGPAHLANAVRTPTVLLYPNRWNFPQAVFRDYNIYCGYFATEGGANIVRGQTMDQITPAAVYQAVCQQMRKGT